MTYDELVDLLNCFGATTDTLENSYVVFDPESPATLRTCKLFSSEEEARNDIPKGWSDMCEVMRLDDWLNEVVW